MRISPTINLSEPTAADKISDGTLAYLRARNQRRLYEFVVEEFERSGLSQADLARRLGKGTDIVCRWLGSPGNWTADTVSDLLFAATGAEPVYGVRYPIQSAKLHTSTNQDDNEVVRDAPKVDQPVPVQTSTVQADKPTKREPAEVRKDRANVLDFETYWDKAA